MLATFRAAALAVALALFSAAQDRTPLLIDTDAGSDDLLAIAFLLARPGVTIEAITVVNGLAHAGAGAANVLRLLELGKRPEIPVFIGARRPSAGHAEFPAVWRRLADQLPGVDLPPTRRRPQTQPAADYIAARIRPGSPPLRILALGPLTNLARALNGRPRAAIRQIVVMGGAIRVPGNLGDGGYLKTSNTTSGNNAAEWNIFIDPAAADAVFRSGIPIELIPLDATNQVPIDAPFLREIEARARSPLGRFAAQVLGTEREAIAGGYYFAWDPLAAAAVAEPGAVRLTPMRIEIRRASPERGRTAEAAGTPNVEAALQADAELFRLAFLKALSR